MPPKSRSKSRPGRAPTRGKAADKKQDKAAPAVANAKAARAAARAAAEAAAENAALRGQLDRYRTVVEKASAYVKRVKLKLGSFEEGAALAFRCLYDTDRDAAAECYDALAAGVRNRVLWEVDEDDTEFPDAKRQRIDSDGDADEYEQPDEDAADGAAEYERTSDEGDESDQEYTQEEWDEWFRLHPSEDEDADCDSDASGFDDEEDEADDRSGSDY